MQDLKEDKSIIFTEDGDPAVTINEILRDESVKIYEEVLESAHKVNVLSNYIKLPEFGNYDSLLNYNDILKPGDLLENTEFKKR